MAAIMPRLRLASLLAALLLACALALGLSSCDYPEQGYYELTGIDSQGRALVAHPFMVEEIVDDTQLTVGFRILLPGSVKGTLVQTELINSQDFTRRGWHLALAQVDTHAGDLDIDIDHIDLESGDSQLEYDGLFRGDAKTKPVQVDGFVAPSSDDGVSRIVSNDGLPKMPKGYPKVERYELRGITKEQFEQRIGGTVEEARRLDARAPDGLSVKHKVKAAKGEQHPSRSGGAAP